MRNENSFPNGLGLYPIFLWKPSLKEFDYLDLEPEMLPSPQPEVLLLF